MPRRVLSVMWSDCSEQWRTASNRPKSDGFHSQDGFLKLLVTQLTVLKIHLRTLGLDPENGLQRLVSRQFGSPGAGHFHGRLLSHGAAQLLCSSPTPATRTYGGLGTEHREGENPKFGDSKQIETNSPKKEFLLGCPVCFVWKLLNLPEKR